MSGSKQMVPAATARLRTSAQALRIVIRDITSIAEAKQVEEVQEEIWGVPERDIVPYDHLLVAKEVGGVLIGAIDGEDVVGFVYGLLSCERDRLQIHSHMLAVKPEWRNLGIGYQLKQAQREQALARGIARITWTFDPLQCMNAYLNFRKLAVVCATYKINYYGESTSSFLHRNGTDRLWVTWLLNSARVCRRMQPGAGVQAPPSGLDEFARLVQVGADNEPRSSEAADIVGAPHLLIEIPEDIGAVECRHPHLAKAWREATRQAFTTALAAGYLVEEFYRVRRGDRGSGVYILSLGKQTEDFVL